MQSYLGCKLYLSLAAVLSAALFLGAEEQVWSDAGPDNLWSTNAPNWADGAVWTNGNSAVFAGAGGTQTGETVDVSASVRVANLTFLTNGYVVADADNDGSFALAGGGDIQVVNAGDAAVMSEVIDGAGFRKTGAGVLQLAGANTFTGVVRVAEGTLRLSKWNPTVLGATGAGNGTIVENNATLDIYGAFTNGYNRLEDLTLSGAGVNGIGALINTGVGTINSGMSGQMTLLGDTLVNCMNRIDFRGALAGNGYTLTKNGGAELAVGSAVTNCKVVINAGQYTFMHALALGSTDFETVMNGGSLQSYGGYYTLTERITCNGGRFSTWGYGPATFNIAGWVTVSSNVEIRAGNDLSSGISTLELSGYFEGAGGLTRITGQYTNNVYVTGDTNTYTGPTIVNSGASLYVGKPNLYSGVLGWGAVTNSGTLYGYSSRLCRGPLVNWGTLYCNTGVVSLGGVANGGKLYLTGGLIGTGSVANSGSLYCFMPSLGAGDVTNTGALYFDATNSAHVVTNAVYGSGTAYLRYGSSVTLAAYYSNANWRVGMGALTLTNGADVFVGSALSIAERQSMGYPTDPSNVVATLNIRDGASLTMYAMSIGNGAAGCMTGLVTQTGGRVWTTGWTGDPTHFAGEYDGLHLGHYPATYSKWDISGGTLTVDNGYRLAIAIDGTGVLYQTGGEVYSQSVVVNARDASPGGYGRLTLEGGVLNVGSNGISAGAGAAYLVEYGGAGGVVRAMTNFTSSLNATLFGSNENAITFDTTNWMVALSGKLSGAGGLNKAGTGTLALSGSNTFSGGIRIQKGRLVPASASALPAGGLIQFDVADDDSGGVLHATNDFSLAGLNVGVANPVVLDKAKHYTIITCDGALSGLVASLALPEPWYLYYDWDNNKVELRAAIGTVMQLR